MNDEETSQALADMRMRMESLEHGLKGRMRALEVKVGIMTCLCAIAVVAAFAVGCMI